jgi:hypothetical protein
VFVTVSHWLSLLLFHISSQSESLNSQWHLHWFLYFALYFIFSQSELRNFFMYIINSEIKVTSSCFAHGYISLFDLVPQFNTTLFLIHPCDTSQICWLAMNWMKTLIYNGLHCPPQFQPIFHVHLSNSGCHPEEKIRQFNEIGKFG